MTEQTADQHERNRLRRARVILQEEGVGSLVVRTLHHGYRKLRPHLPRTTVTYNGIEVSEGRMLDRVVPYYRTDRPEYKGPNVDEVNEHVDEGDEVVVVGAGAGVTTVYAARQVGPEGRVIAFEGSPFRVEVLQETLERHDVDDVVDAKAEIVGPGEFLKDASGEFRESSTTDPADLPECDVLEMDCEGAEQEILRGIGMRPDVIIVETHGFRGAPTEETIGILSERGYRVRSRQPVADEEYATENDAYVVTAVREDE